MRVTNVFNGLACSESDPHHLGNISNASNCPKAIFHPVYGGLDTQCHNTPKTNKVLSRKHSVTTLSRNVKAKKNAKTGLEEP